MVILTEHPFQAPATMWGVFVKDNVVALFLYADQAREWGERQWGGTTPGFEVKEVRF